MTQSNVSQSVKIMLAMLVLIKSINFALITFLVNNPYK